jgi:hypothetical protein
LIKTDEVRIGGVEEAEFKNCPAQLVGGCGK